MRAVQAEPLEVGGHRLRPSLKEHHFDRIGLVAGWPGFSKVFPDLTNLHGTRRYLVDVQRLTTQPQEEDRALDSPIGSDAPPPRVQALLLLCACDLYSD